MDIAGTTRTKHAQSRLCPTRPSQQRKGIIGVGASTPVFSRISSQARGGGETLPMGMAAVKQRRATRGWRARWKREGAAWACQDEYGFAASVPWMELD